MMHSACVASVSVWFRSKEIPRKGTFGFDRARNETRAKKWKRGEGEGRDLHCDANFISCRVTLVLRCFYKSSLVVCRGENGKPFCLAELWPCTNTRRRSKILDLNACHILPLQIQLSGGLELTLQNFTHPFRSFLLDGLRRQMYKACIDRSDSLRFHH